VRDAQIASTEIDDPNGNRLCSTVKRQTNSLTFPGLPFRTTHQVWQVLAGCCTRSIRRGQSTPINFILMAPGRWYSQPPIPRRAGAIPRTTLRTDGNDPGRNWKNTVLSIRCVTETLRSYDALGTVTTSTYERERLQVKRTNAGSGKQPAIPTDGLAIRHQRNDYPAVMTAKYTFNFQKPASDGYRCEAGCPQRITYD